MGPRIEHEPRPALPRPAGAPSGQHTRDVDDVLLCVAAVHAQGVEFEEFPGVVLIEACGQPCASLLQPTLCLTDAIALCADAVTPCGLHAPETLLHLCQTRRL